MSSPLDTAESPPLDTAETPPLDTAESPPLDTAESPPLDTADTPPLDTAESSPLDTAENPPLESDGFDFTDEVGVPSGEVPAWINGVYQPLEQVKVSVLDRGFLFADGVYEVVPVFNRRLFYWARHKERLFRSLEGLYIDSTHIDWEAFESAAQRLAKHSNGKKSCLYIQITRGATQLRHHDISHAITPTVVMWMTALAPFTSNPVPMRLCALEDIRWQWRHLKTISLLGNIMLRHQAQRKGYDDALLIKEGRAIEASAANYLVVWEGEIVIPDSDYEMLPGITRIVIEDLVKSEQLSCRRSAPLKLSELYQAEEVWLCSSTKLLLPVSHIDERPTRTPQGRGVGRRLLEAFIRLIENYRA